MYPNLANLDSVDIKALIQSDARAARAAAYVLTSGWQQSVGADAFRLSEAKLELADPDGYPPPATPEEIRQAAQALLAFAKQLEG